MGFPRRCKAGRSSTTSNYDDNYFADSTFDSTGGSNFSDSSFQRSSSPRSQSADDSSYFYDSTFDKTYDNENTYANIGPNGLRSPVSEEPIYANVIPKFPRSPVSEEPIYANVRPKSRKSTTDEEPIYANVRPKSRKSTTDEEPIYANVRPKLPRSPVSDQPVYSEEDFETPENEPRYTYVLGSNNELEYVPQTNFTPLPRVYKRPVPDTPQRPRTLLPARPRTLFPAIPETPNNDIKFGAYPMSPLSPNSDETIYKDRLLSTPQTPRDQSTPQKRQKKSPDDTRKRIPFDPSSIKTPATPINKIPVDFMQIELSPGSPQTPKIAKDLFEGCRGPRLMPKTAPRPSDMEPGIEDRFVTSKNIWKLDAKNFAPFLRSNATTAVMFYEKNGSYASRYKLAKTKFVRAAENPINEKGAYAAVDCEKEAGLCSAQNVGKDLTNPVFRLYTGETLLGDLIDPYRFNKLRPSSTTSDAGLGDDLEYNDDVFE